ncbi:MAG: AAA family ATPase, partial [Flavobacteriaceae bacterium]|nr:AAA family ATPase [Flavobacteriaceae bacterium]
CLKLNVEVTNDVHLDLEILDAIQKDQLNLCKDTAIRYGGNVSGIFMNNLAVYFGYPESNDTDARRAGRTALELVTEVKKRSTLMLAQHGVALSIQIGLHTGTVLVQRNHIPEGNVPNTAFDLVHKAASGNVLVSAPSKKLLDQFLEFEKVELTDNSNTKGILETFQLVGERQTEALSSLRPWSATREMIGRDNEKNEVLKLWGLTSDKGNAIIINGQAGIGKSKLTYEVKKEVRSIGGMVRECRCLPEHRNNALYPFFNMLRNHWGIVGMEDKEMVIEKVKNVLENAGCLEKGSLPLLCSWLSISLPEEYAISQGTPEEQKKLLFHILKQCILQIDREKSFLLVVEDLHWLDPTSTEFIQYLLSDIEVNGYLLVMTTRPVFENPWKYKYLSQINLEILPRNDIQLLVESVLKGESISNRTLDYIDNRADGIPLFVEELTSMLLEKNYIQLEQNVYELIESSDDIVPMTLLGLLNAKLDRLSLAKETAQLAAAIGREFSYELLVKSSVKDEATVQNDLNLLMNSDIIYRQRRVQGENYIFRHALIRDAAYEGMLSAFRKEVHSNIANTLTEFFPETVKETPFVVAIHLAEADKYNEAINYGVKAAKTSIDRSASFEVLEYTKILLSWCTLQKKDDVNINALLKVYCIRANALMNKYGWASKEVKDVSNKAFQLIQNHGYNSFELNNIISAYWVLFTYFHVASDRDRVEELTTNFLKMSLEVNDKTLEISAKTIRGIHLFLSGRLDEAITFLKNVLEYESDYGNDKPTYTIGVENFCWAAACLAYPLWLAGNKLEARKVSDFALERARKLNHIPTLAIMLFYRANLYSWDLNKEEAKKLSKEAIKISEKNNLMGPKLYASVINHWANDDLVLLDKTLKQFETSGCIASITKYKALAADLEYQKGNIHKALQRIDDCLTLCGSMKEYYYHSELLKLKEFYTNKLNEK